MEEYCRQLETQPVFVANECALSKKPFKPKLEKHTIDVVPFPLKMTTRLQERRIYDKNVEKLLDEKKKQVRIKNQF